MKRDEDGANHRIRNILIKNYSPPGKQKVQFVVSAHNLGSPRARLSCVFLNTVLFIDTVLLTPTSPLGVHRLKSRISWKLENGVR